MMAKRGRPTDFKPEFVEQVRKLCELGATDVEIADFFGVTVRTLYRWKLERADFCQSLTIGKTASDDRIERSLYEKASGFRFTEQQAFKIKDGKDAERVEVVEVERFAPPDTTAQIFWLKNRRRDQWRDKQDHEVTGADGGPIRTEHDIASGIAFLMRKGLAGNV